MPQEARTVDDTLDLVWIADAGQGNLTEAAAGVRELLAAQRDPMALFKAAAIARLQGRPAIGQEMLEEAYRHDLRGSWRIALSACGRLGDHLQTVVTVGGTSLTLGEVSHGRWRQSSPWHERYREAMGLDDGDEMGVLGRVIADCLLALPGARDLALSVAEDNGREVDPVCILPQSSALLECSEVNPLVTLILSIDLVECVLLACGPGAVPNWVDALEEEAKRAELSGVQARLALARARARTVSAIGGLPSHFGYSISISQGGPVGPRGAVEAPLHLSDGEHEAIVTELLRAEQLYDLCEWRRGWARTRHERAAIALWRGDAQAAREGFDAARTTFEKAGDTLGAWEALFGAVMATAHVSNPVSELLDAGRGCAEFAVRNGVRPWAVGLALAALGGSARRASLGDPEAARKLIDVASEVFRVLDMPRFEAGALASRAGIHALLNAGPEVALDLSRAVERLREARNTNDLGSLEATEAELEMALRQLGAAFSMTGAQMQGVGARALALRASLPEGPPIDGKRVVDAAKASVEATRRFQRDCQRLAPAELQLIETAWEEASDLDRQRLIVECRSLASWVANTARTLAAELRGWERREAGDERGAREHFEQVIRLSSEQKDADWHEARLLSVMGRQTEAIAALDRYVARGRPTEDAITEAYRVFLPTQGTRGSTYRLVAQLYADLEAWLSAAREYEAAGLSLDGELPAISAASWQADVMDRIQLALVAEGLKRFERGGAMLFEAIEAAEARRVSVRESRHRRRVASDPLFRRAYGETCGFLFRRGRAEEAFAVAERGRAQALTEGLATLRAAGPDEYVAWRAHLESVARLERVEAQLSMATTEQIAERVDALAKEVEAVTESVRTTEAELFQRSQTLRHLYLPAHHLLGSADVASHLPGDTVLLAYHYYHDRLWAWAVTPAGLGDTAEQSTFLGTHFRSAAFEAAIRSFQRAVRAGTGYHRLAHELSALLIGPFTELVASASQVVVVPHRQLSTLPFAALRFEGDYLTGSTRSLTVLPAASLLQFHRPAPADSRPILIVGDPDEMRWSDPVRGVGHDLPGLPGAWLEAQAIASLYDVAAVTDGAASEDTVREALERKPRIVHFATHATLSAGSPLDSAVQLSAGEGISLDELVGLRPESELVVLSGCDTGLGDLQGTELVSLGHALLGTDVRRVLVAQNPVPDAVTPLLMFHMHRLMAGSVSAASALSGAQAWLRTLTADQAIAQLRAMGALVTADSEVTLALRDASVAACESEVLAASGRPGEALELTGRACSALEAVGQSARAGALRRRGRRYRLAALVDPDPDPEARVFEPPGYWACFTVLGDAAASVAPSHASEEEDP